MNRKCEFSRRDVFQLGGAAALAGPAAPYSDDARLREAISKLEYLTPLERAVILDKGKAEVAKLPPAALRDIGLAPETWTLEVAADPAGGSTVERSVKLDWNGLMKLAETHAVRFLHVCVCTNGADPFHMTLWEGVPLREIVWMTGPKAQIRRVCYESYHPEGRAPFQASLPLGQVLETPPGQMPVVLAYKMNGRFIPAAQGGPARMMVPGAYGSKQIKWVRRILLTNDYRSSDSDAAVFNNDTESAMKTRARFIHPPAEVPAGQPFPLTGMVQIGVSGLRVVQYSAGAQGAEAAWKDAAILPAPAEARGLPGQAEWPLRYTIAHWAALHPGLPPGRYELRCRTIDGNGIAQPMPRPLLRTGFNAIHRVDLLVKG